MAASTVESLSAMVIPRGNHRKMIKRAGIRLTATDHRDGKHMVFRAEFPNGTRTARVQADDRTMFTLFRMPDGAVFGVADADGETRKYRSLRPFNRFEIAALLGYEPAPDGFRGLDS